MSETSSTFDSNESEAIWRPQEISTHWSTVHLSVTAHSSQNYDPRDLRDRPFINGDYRGTERGETSATFNSATGRNWRCIFHQ
ncbi:hypothetical protein NKJ36_32225 [Mesorhizobium sp. M0142]|uniref:hypothetical protein n=1 Tax=Mesorhizobium sp. M0142 TaxID=2956894 RepID=UPI00333AFA87